MTRPALRGGRSESRPVPAEDPAAKPYLPPQSTGLAVRVRAGSERSRVPAASADPAVEASRAVTAAGHGPRAQVPEVCDPPARLPDGATGNSKSAAFSFSICCRPYLYHSGEIAGIC